MIAASALKSLKPNVCAKNDVNKDNSIGIFVLHVSEYNFVSQLWWYPNVAHLNFDINLVLISPLSKFLQWI